MIPGLSSSPSFVGLNEFGSLRDVAPASRLEASAPAAAPSATGKADFAGLLGEFVSEVDGKMSTAATEQSRLLSGQSSSLHQTMISMQEASTAFSLMVEVRNKLVEGYQELMRLQV